MVTKIKKAARRSTSNVTSIFFNVPLVEFLGKYDPVLAENLEFPILDSDVYVGVVRANRLDFIAEKVYGNPDLWWVIAIANNILDPFDVKQGAVLRIPDFATAITRFSLSRERLR